MTEPAATRANQDPVTASQTGRTGSFLLGCAGANPDHIHERAERNWYYSLGFSVILTAVTAGLSASFLVSACFADAPTAVVVGSGLFWMVVVFNLDRLIVSRILARPNFFSKAALFLTRFVLAAAVAILMSIGIELVFFKSEIDHQVRINNATEQRIEIQKYEAGVQTAKTEAEKTYKDELDAPGLKESGLKTQISTLEAALVRANKDYACEAQPLTQTGCESGSGVTGPDGREAQTAAGVVASTGEDLRLAREALRAYTINLIDVPFTPEELEVCGNVAVQRLTVKQADTCAANLLVDAKIKDLAPPPAASDSVDGPIRRLAALSSLGSGEHGTTVWATRILLLVVIASIDLVPLSAKLFGGATGHDIRARIDNIKATSDYARELDNEQHPTPQHLHKEPRDGFHVFGVGLGHRHRAALVREDYHLQRLLHQAEVEKARWSQPESPLPSTKHYTDAGTATDDASQDTARSVSTPPSGRVGPNHILRTKDGTEYHVHSEIDGRTELYELWSCSRRDNPGNGLYVAKLCYVNGNEDFHSGLTGLNRDVTAAGVHSEHVIDIVSGPVVQADDATGARYVIMPYYDRGDLLAYAEDAWGAPQQKPPLGELLALIRQILVGLRATHASGILHLDMKPPNVLVDVSEGFAKAVITDFGIAAVIQELENHEVTSYFRGTATYAPLEQILPGKRHGRRAPVSDLWAVGAITFRMLLNAHPRQYAEVDANLPMIQRPGQRPIPDRNSPKYENWLDTAPVPPRLDAVDPSIPRPLADLIERWLENDQKLRVTPGIDTSRRGGSDVMNDALAQLDATIEAIR